MVQQYSAVMIQQYIVTVLQQYSALMIQQYSGTVLQCYSAAIDWPVLLYNGVCRSAGQTHLGLVIPANPPAAERLVRPK